MATRKTVDGRQGVHVRRRIREDCKQAGRYHLAVPGKFAGKTIIVARRCGEV